MVAAPEIRLPPPSPSVPPFQAKLFTVSPPEPPKLPPPRVSCCPVQVPSKLSVPASTSRSEPNEVPEPVLMVTLAPLTSSTPPVLRSEEHTSELQSRCELVCRLPLDTET